MRRSPFFTSIEKAPTGDRWLHEIKFIGIVSSSTSPTRTLSYLSGTATTGPSGSAKVATGAFPINASSAIIDGEIVVLAPDGTTDFSVLQNELEGKSTRIVMVAFDLLYLNGYDLRKLPPVERKRI